MKTLSNIALVIAGLCLSGIFALGIAYGIAGFELHDNAALAVALGLSTIAHGLAGFILRDAHYENL